MHVANYLNHSCKVKINFISIEKAVLHNQARIYTASRKYSKADARKEQQACLFNKDTFLLIIRNIAQVIKKKIDSLIIIVIRYCFYLTLRYLAQLLRLSMACI